MGKYNFTLENAATQLSDYYYSWEENERTLESFIKLAPVEAFLDDNSQLFIGTVYFEYLKKTRNIVKEGENLVVKMDQEVIDTKWSQFWLSSIGYVLIQEGRNKRKVFEILSSAFHQPSNAIELLGFDIDRIAQDYPHKWLGAFIDREGHVHSGTLYGDDIEEDIELGEAYRQTHTKNQLGFITEYFDGIEIKVRVTRNGFLQIFKSLDKTPENAIEFIRDELDPYLIEPLR